MTDANTGTISSPTKKESVRYKVKIKVLSVSELPKVKGLVHVSCASSMDKTEEGFSSKKEPEDGVVVWQEENHIAKQTYKIKEKEEVIVGVHNEKGVIFQGTVDLIPLVTKLKPGGKKNYTTELKGKKNCLVTLSISILREDNSGKEKKAANSPDASSKSPRSKNLRCSLDVDREDMRDIRVSSEEKGRRKNGKDKDSSDDSSDDNSKKIDTPTKTTLSNINSNPSSPTTEGKLLRAKLASQKAKAATQTLSHGQLRSSSPEGPKSPIQSSPVAGTGAYVNLKTSYGSKDDSAIGVTQRTESVTYSPRVGSVSPQSPPASPSSSQPASPSPAGGESPASDPGPGGRPKPIKYHTFNLRMLSGSRKEDGDKVKAAADAAAVASKLNSPGSISSLGLSVNNISAVHVNGNGITDTISGPAQTTTPIQEENDSIFATPKNPLSTSSTRLVIQSKSVRPGKYNTLPSAVLFGSDERRDELSSNSSINSTPSSTASATTTSGISSPLSGSTNSPSSSLATSVKYPTLPKRKVVPTSPQIPEKVEDELGNSDKRNRALSDADKQFRRMNVAETLDVAASLKKEYAQKQREEDEKFLLEDVILQGIQSEVHAIGFIIFKSLINWEGFTDPGIPDRIIITCQKAVQKYESSRIILFQFLSTFITLLYLAEEHRKKQQSPEEEAVLLDFISRVRSLVAEVFERLLGTLYKRLEPVLKTSIMEALHSADTEKIVQDDKASLGEVLNKILDYISASAEHCIFDSIRKQFFRRIFHYLAASLLDALCQERGNSYGVGIQLKLVLTRIEEWARSKIGHEYGQVANDELEPARQAANVICFLKKDDILQVTTRETVCPNLRPAHLSHLLKAYKPDQFDKEITSPSILLALDKQELTYIATSKTFNPTLMAPVDLNFEMTRLELSSIGLPKKVVDRSGFSFLKSNFGNNIDTKPERKEKW